MTTGTTIGLALFTVICTGLALIVWSAVCIDKNADIPYPIYRLVVRTDGLYEVESKHRENGEWHRMPMQPNTKESAEADIKFFRDLRDREERERTMERTPLGDER